MPLDWSRKACKKDFIYATSGIAIACALNVPLGKFSNQVRTFSSVVLGIDRIPSPLLPCFRLPELPDVSSLIVLAHVFLRYGFVESTDGAGVALLLTQCSLEDFEVLGVVNNFPVTGVVPERRLWDDRTDRLLRLFLDEPPPRPPTVGCFVDEMFWYLLVTKGLCLCID